MFKALRLGWLQNSVVPAMRDDMRGAMHLESKGGQEKGKVGGGFKAKLGKNYTILYI